MELDCAGRIVDLTRPRVMGVLNLTPDSFSDGGQWTDPDAAVAHAHAMAGAGAALIDVGGESTRPGADAVPLDEERRRVLPVIERLAAELDLPVSIDTSKPEIMREAVAAGAGMINDVYALRRPGALEAAAAAGVPVCLMHMQGEPRSMQENPRYDEVVGDVIDFLRERVSACERAGIPRERIVLDPGIGFGKTVEHNLALLANLDRLAAEGLPVLVGASRKSLIGKLTGAGAVARLPGSLAAAVVAAWQGVVLVRAHDVAETVQALAVLSSVREWRQEATQR